jgi:signal transduction histidine kinase
MTPAMAQADDRDQYDDQRKIPDRRRNRLGEQRQLRSIVAQSPDGIVIVGAAGLIRFANPAAEHLFGRRIHELLDTPFGFPLANGEPAAIDVVRPGGASVAAELRVVDVTWEGEPAHLVTIRDVTERRRSEERAHQLERERAARAEAEAANQAKSDLLATMSHELRTPLNAVLGYADLLDLGIGGTLGPEQRHHLDRIRASSRHLLGLVDQVLDLAKVDAGRLEVRIGVYPAASTAEAAGAIIQPLAESRGITFVDRCTHNPRLYYVGDEDRVRQILVNLLTNAVKFNRAGGTVTLECGEDSPDEAGGRVQVHESTCTFFRVSDTGIGISSDGLARIFQPFVQMDAGRTRSQDGFGLGLTISRRLARVMNGDLTVQSTPGSGSSFTLWLPSPNRDESEQPDSTGEPRASTIPLRGIAEIGEILLRELEPLLEAFVARIRAECPTPGAGSLKFSQLADHVPSYLADLAGMLIALDESVGQPSSVLADASDIHRLVAARHGAQRVRLGWDEKAIRCEYDILRSEIERVVRQRGRAAGAKSIEDALGIVMRFLEQAEETSLRALLAVR